MIPNTTAMVEGILKYTSNGAATPVIIKLRKAGRRVHPLRIVDTDCPAVCECIFT
jgi:hypothetical protein